MPKVDEQITIRAGHLGTVELARRLHWITSPELLLLALFPGLLRRHRVRD
jgi:hypothetical protein